MNKYFVYTGNAYPHKNLVNLVKAMVLLNSNRNEKVVLKISCSRSVFTDRLQKIIEDQGASGFVELLGYVPDDKISDLYKKSVAFVFPTLSEGFGLPPMEAINANTLAVVSDIPVLKEIYSDSVMYFNPLDISEIATALENVLSLKIKDRERLIKKAQLYIKKYSWEKMAKETLNLYESF